MVQPDGVRNGLLTSLAGLRGSSEQSQLRCELLLQPSLPSKGYPQGTHGLLHFGGR